MQFPGEYDAMSELPPLRFHPIYKDYVWGGQKIITHFKRPDPGLPRVAESWEISDRADGMSVVSDGPLAGKSLHDLTSEFGPQLLGHRVKDRKFPLLIKLIDARETLSVQVHPDDASAARFGGEAKSEMWYVLQADPGACVYRGFIHDIKPPEFEQALREKKLPGLLKKIPVRAGDTIYVPAGCVHAIGAGCLLLEIQQNSNTTHRIYDWDRSGPDGKPRELHVDQAARVISWKQTPDIQPEHWPFFRFDTFTLNGSIEERMDGESFHALFVESGRVILDGKPCDPGSSILLPAAMSNVTLSGQAQVCRVTLT